MPVIDRIPLQRSVAVITEDQIIVRPSRAQLVAPMVQAAIAAAAVAVIVVLFDRVPLWLLMLSLAVALLFGPASILGIVYQIYGSSFVVERHKQSARWQQGLLGLGLGTRDLVPFGRIDYIEVRGDQDDELTSGERHDLVQWDVRLVKDNGRALEIGAFAAARPLAADALGRANRLAEHIGEMTGHEARTLPPLEADGAAPVADGPPGRRRRRLARRPAAPPPPGELDVVTLDGPDRPLELMAAAESIAVVGIASDPGRPSNDVARYLIEAGYRVHLVNPTEDGPILGLPVYDSLRSLPEPVDIVDIFRRPEHVPAVVEDAIAAHAKAVWMQLDIVNEQAAERARSAGLEVVMDRCTKIEHRRLPQTGGGDAPHSR